MMVQLVGSRRRRCSRGRAACIEDVVVVVVVVVLVVEVEVVSLPYPAKDGQLAGGMVVYKSGCGGSEQVRMTGSRI